jgi:uncharacterized membrane protein
VRAVTTDDVVAPAWPTWLTRACSLTWWRHRTVWLAVALLTGAALAVRCVNLGQRSFWLDELNALSVAGLQRFQDVAYALTVEPNMTLYYWSLWGWLQFVSVDAPEWLIRLPAVVAGAAAVPLVFLLGRQLHSQAAGLAAAGLVAANAFHVVMSQEARSYALLGSLTTLSFLLLDRALTGGRRRDWALHGLVTALAFYCHFYTAFVILAQALFILAVALSRRSLAAFGGPVLSGLVQLALVAQLVPVFTRKTDGANLSHLQRPDLQDFLNFLAGLSGGSRVTLALVLALAAYGLLSKSASRARGYRDALLLTWLVVPVGLAFGISQVRPIFTDRYLFGVLPSLALLAGVGAAQLRWPRSAAVVGAVAAFALVALWRDGFEARRTEQWREAARHVEANAEPGDGYIFITKWGQTGFEYYLDWHWGRNPAAPYADVYESFDWREAAKVPKYRGVTSMDGLRDFASGHPRIWLVLSHEFDSVYDGDVAEPVRDWLTRRGYAATQRPMRGVRVILYQRRAAA